MHNPLFSGRYFKLVRPHLPYRIHALSRGRHLSGRPNKISASSYRIFQSACLVRHWRNPFNNRGSVSRWGRFRILLIPPVRISLLILLGTRFQATSYFAPLSRLIRGFLRKRLRAVSLSMAKTDCLRRQSMDTPPSSSDSSQAPSYTFFLRLQPSYI